MCSRKKRGHVFQGRFKAIVVDKESYLLELCRYVVLNPVRAGLVEKPEQWQWSSYQATSGLRQSPEYLTIDWILGMFGRHRKASQKRYQSFIEAGAGQKSPWEELKGQVLLGEESFVEKFKELLTGKEQNKEISRVQRYSGRPDLETLFQGREAKPLRNKGIADAHLKYGYTLKKIADHLKVHYTTLSKVVGKARGG
ncbi:MAG: hypothetical protein HGA78_00105 [Nitrospirales bacterium]|nr:hypothetical protein [Nitrospirales bacterium]